MGGTDHRDHLHSMYGTSIESRKWTIRTIFHFAMAAILNAHVLYKLRNCLQTGDLWHEVGDFIEEAANQMKAQGSAATRTPATLAAASADVVDIKVADFIPLDNMGAVPKQTHFRSLADFIFKIKSGLPTS